jgi:hypothetical protein
MDGSSLCENKNIKEKSRVWVRGRFNVASLSSSVSHHLTLYTTSYSSSIYIAPGPSMSTITRVPYVYRGCDVVFVLLTRLWCLLV